MSSGLALRPAGMRAKTRSYKPGTCARTVGQFGLKPAGQERIDLDVVRRPGQGQALAELDDAPLAGGVRGGVTRPKVGGHAADIDDLSAQGDLGAPAGLQPAPLG